MPATIGRLDYRYEYEGRWMRNVFWFRGPPTLHPGFVFANWRIAAQIWHLNTTLFALPRDFTQASYWAFYNTGTFTHSDTSGLFLPIFAPYNVLDPALCTCFTTRSNPGRHGYGRLYGPGLTTDALNFLGDYKPAYQSLYSNGANQMRTNFSYNLDTFIPCLYSPALGTFSNFSDIIFLPTPRYLRRRRMARDRISQLYTYPIVP